MTDVERRNLNIIGDVISELMSCKDTILVSIGNSGFCGYNVGQYKIYLTTPVDKSRVIIDKISEIFEVSVEDTRNFIDIHESNGYSRIVVYINCYNADEFHPYTRVFLENTSINNQQYECFKSRLSDIRSRGLIPIKENVFNEYVEFDSSAYANINNTLNYNNIIFIRQDYFKPRYSKKPINFMLVSNDILRGSTNAYTFSPVHIKLLGVPFSRKPLTDDQYNNFRRNNNAKTSEAFYRFLDAALAEREVLRNKEPKIAGLVIESSRNTLEFQDVIFEDGIRRDIRRVDQSCLISHVAKKLSNMITIQGSTYITVYIDKDYIGLFRFDVYTKYPVISRITRALVMFGFDNFRIVV